MKCNVGPIDRVLRVIVGIGLIGLAASGTIGWWGYLGLIPLLTAVVRLCPLYALLGISTCTPDATK